MHVCLVTPAYPPALGGVARYVAELAAWLHGAGHEVTVIDGLGTDADGGAPAGRGRGADDGSDGPDGPRDPDGAAPTGVRVLRVGRAADRERPLRRSVRVDRALRALHARCPVDVVEVANWKALGVVPALRRGRLPTVVRVTTGIRDVGQDGRRASPAEALQHELERLSVVRADAVIAPTRAHWERARRAYRCAGRDAFVVPFAVDVPSSCAAAPPPRSDTRPSASEAPSPAPDARPPAGAPADGPPWTVLAVGRPSRRKGFDVLQAALGRPALHDVRLLAVGPGTAAGPLSEPELRAAYARAHVVAVPARYESFGLVALEAMAAGVPVVAARSGGLPEVLGDAGALVAPGDPDALAAALRALLDDPARRAAMAAAGVERARRRHAPDAHGAATLRAYAAAMASRGA